MYENLIKRIFTSILLLSLLIIVNFSYQFIFIGSILILGLVVCIEANNMFIKLVSSHLLKKNILFKKSNLKFLILNLLTFFYIFFIFCNFSYEIHSSESPTFFLYIISICFFTDIGGYIIGKTFGGKKLIKISPKKTISGTIGSFIFSIIPLIIFSNFTHLELDMNKLNILFSLLISLISQIGDLCISYLKRKANVKDTGKLLPCHGGVLDRIDGIIFALPFSYFLLSFI